MVIIIRNGAWKICIWFLQGTKWEKKDKKYANKSIQELKMNFVLRPIEPFQVNTQSVIIVHCWMPIKKHLLNFALEKSPSFKFMFIFSMALRLFAVINITFHNIFYHCFDFKWMWTFPPRNVARIFFPYISGELYE